MSPSTPADTNDGQPSTSTPPPQTTEQSGQPKQNGTSTEKKQSKKERPQVQTSTTDQNIAEAGAGVKLTGAQLKKQKAAEKAARRAEKVAIKGEQAQQVEQPTQSKESKSGKKDGTNTSNNDQLQPPPPPPQSTHKRKGSNQPPEPGAIRIPFRPNQLLPTTSQPQTQQAPSKEKKVPMVAHLYPTARPATLLSASREIHPSILTLTLHTRSLTLAGSTARTLALLLTLKRVIRSYTTPSGTALPRHLTTHLSHQISYLSSARPLAIPQGTAIRWLKTLISRLDPDLDENDAKRHITSAIDGYILERLTMAAEEIASQASSRISSEPASETILVYGKSSVVERTLLHAARTQHKRFKVIVIDSRPLFEGRNLAKALLRAGMRADGELAGCEVVYALISGLADVLEQHSVTKCFLGASAMLGNGSLYSRCGTAMVASMAKSYKVPVVVLAESIKFSAKMSVDSLSMNELGDVDVLVERELSGTFTDLSVVVKDEEASKKGGGGGKKKDDGDGKGESDEKDQSGLRGWRDQPGLYLLNLMYDCTPKDYLDMVICELGTLPPGAVPVVNGVHGDEE